MNLLKHDGCGLVLSIMLMNTSSAFTTPTNLDADQPKMTQNDRIELGKIEMAMGELFVELSRLKADKKIATNAHERGAIRERMKVVKHEMKALEAKAQAVSGGIYIGSGALVIILLLILLL